MPQLRKAVPTLDIDRRRLCTLSRSCEDYMTRKAVLKFPKRPIVKKEVLRKKYKKEIKKITGEN